MPSGVLPILLVESDAALLDILHVVLETEGLRVLAAADAEEALRILEAETPALVIADGAVRDSSGLGVADHMGADTRWRGIPIIVLSGNRGRQPLANVVAWLAKPVSVDVLLEQVRAALT